jgi:hypothetical protein
VPGKRKSDGATRGDGMTECAFLHRIVSELWPQAETAAAGIWAVLDAASDERIAGALEKARLDYCCLFPGRLDPALKTAAPYLVKLRCGHAFSEYIISEGWDRHWGVFLQSGTSMEELRFHLKQFLRVFLPTCTAHELRIFYGPILRYVMEDEEPENLIEFALHDREFRERKVALSSDNHS